MPSTDSGGLLQDAFLRQMRQEKVSLTVFLINGIKLQGTIMRYDKFCLLLKRGDQVQVIYKHAVSTIVPPEGTMVVAEDCTNGEPQPHTPHEAETD